MLDAFALNLQGSEEDWKARPPHTVRGQAADLLRLCAALERIPAAYKAEIGQWLLERGDSLPPDIRWWTLARLGARQPLHGQWQELVSAEVAEGWLQQLLQLDWRRQESCAFW